MTSGTGNQQAAGSTFKWLILFCLLLGHLASAAHLADHEMTEPGESCEICLATDRDDDSLADTDAHSPVESPGSPEWRIAADPQTEPEVSVYSARASP